MSAPITTEQLWSVLASLPDPEFGLNIVDLGLIYEADTNGHDVNVAMTLTSPACPAGQMMYGGVQAALAAIPGVGEVRVDLVWEPLWTPELLTPYARQQLGWSPPPSGTDGQIEAGQ